MSQTISNARRRAFLQRSAALAATGVAAPMALNLSAIGRLAAAEASDYKALVCVFLYGANDHYNTIVSYDPEDHRRYVQARPGLAYGRGRLEQTVLRSTESPQLQGREFAFAPELGNLHGLWNEGRVNTLLNVGPLLRPTTKAEYLNGAPIPPKIFSHNDQQSVWQSLASEGATSGWGGKLGDAVLDGAGGNLFSAVSVAGDALFLSGDSTSQYRVTPRSPSGSIRLAATRAAMFGSRAVPETMRRLMTEDSENWHLMARELQRTTRRSIEANEQLEAALTSAPALEVSLGTSRLGAQLDLVARMIAARESLGVRRQIFFVGIGGFDTHDNLREDHPPLLRSIDEALAGFYRATETLGVANQVTAFTASDFGRTLSANGDGTDHGWGSHHLVVGGAVNGKRFTGRPPALGNGGSDDVGRGRLLPTTSIEQLAATLGKWFGAGAGELADILPQLSEFGAADLGFLRQV